MEGLRLHALLVSLYINAAGKESVEFMTKAVAFNVVQSVYQDPWACISIVHVEPFLGSLSKHDFKTVQEQNVRENKCMESRQPHMAP